VADASATSTIPNGPSSLNKRRAGYAVTSALLALVMLLAIADAAGDIATLGVDTHIAHDSRSGVDLAVNYGAVSRPALATPFDIRVHRTGGFDGPVRIAVDQEYLRMWDQNGLAPAPSAETVMGSWLIWEFDQPIGDTLLVTYDGRIEPAAQEGRSGSVAVLDDADVPIVQVDFTTRVWP
jgi:hypothetical protein